MMPAIVSVPKAGFFSKIEEGDKITTGIFHIFRGLFFESDKEIGKKDHLCTDTNWAVKSGSSGWELVI